MHFFFTLFLCLVSGIVQAQSSPISAQSSSVPAQLPQSGLQPTVATTPQSSVSPLTVDEAVATAIGNNPRLSASVRDVSAGRSGVRSARALTNPEFLFTPGALSVAGQNQELLLSQPLELNGMRSARAGIASAQLRRTQSEATVELRNLVAQTKMAYYELARAREQRALAADLLTATQEFDRITRRQIELGSRPGIEATQSGIEVVRARQQVTQAESQVTVAQSALNTLLGREPNVGIGLLAPLPDTVQPVSDETAVRQALANRAEIASEAAGRDAFLQEARLARAEGRPDLAPQFRLGSVTSGFRGPGVGLGLSLPLFDLGSRRNRIRQAKESARAQSDRIIAAQNLVRQEVAQALARLKAAQATIRDYQDGVLLQSRRLLDASRIGFQEGSPRYTILTVLEAQRTYRGVQSEYINALATQAQAGAELERAIGAVPASLVPAIIEEPRRRK